MMKSWPSSVLRCWFWVSGGRAAGGSVRGIRLAKMVAVDLGMCW